MENTTGLRDWVESYIHHHVEYNPSGFVKKGDLVYGVAAMAKRGGYEDEFYESAIEETVTILESILGEMTVYEYNNEIEGWYGYGTDSTKKIKNRNLDDVLNSYINRRVSNGDAFYTEKQLHDDFKRWYTSVTGAANIKWKKNEYFPSLLAKLDSYKSTAGFNLSMTDNYYREPVCVNKCFVSIKLLPVKYGKDQTMCKKEVYDLLTIEERHSIIPHFTIPWVCESWNKFEQISMTAKVGFGNFSDKLLSLNLLQDSDSEIFIKSLNQVISYKELYQREDYVDIMLKASYREEDYNRLRELSEVLDLFAKHIDVVASELRHKAGNNVILAQELFEYKNIRIKPDLVIGDCIYDIKEAIMTDRYIFDQVLYLVIGRELGYDLRKIGFICPSQNYVVEHDLSDWIFDGGCERFLAMMNEKIKI